MTTIAEISEPSALPTHTTTGELLILKLSGIDALPITIHRNAIRIISLNMCFIASQFPAQYGIFDEQVCEKRNDANAEQHIKYRESLASISLGYQITIADGCERYGAEIYSIQPFKMLDGMIEQGAQTDDKNSQGGSLFVLPPYG